MEFNRFSAHTSKPQHFEQRSEHFVIVYQFFSEQRRVSNLPFSSEQSIQMMLTNCGKIVAIIKIVAWFLEAARLTDCKA
jgi:hypothetical protein